jgi:hypothetical protein
LRRRKGRKRRRKKRRISSWDLSGVKRDFEEIDDFDPDVRLCHCAQEAQVPSCPARDTFHTMMKYISHGDWITRSNLTPSRAVSGAEYEKD